MRYEVVGLLVRGAMVEDDGTDVVVVMPAPAGSLADRVAVNGPLALKVSGAAGASAGDLVLARSGGW